MCILKWAQVVIGLLAIGFGAIVLRGVLRARLRGRWVRLFMQCNLIASVAGLLPLTHHLTLLQGVSMLSVYCAGGVAVAWCKFDLVGRWRTVFALLLAVVLYLNAVSLSIQMFRHSLLSAVSTMQFGACFEVIQLLFVAFFIVVSVRMVKNCQSIQSHVQCGR